MSTDSDRTNAALLRAIDGYERRLTSWADAAVKLAAITVDPRAAKTLRDAAHDARQLVRVSRGRVSRGELVLAARLVRQAAGRLRWDLLSSVDATAVRS